MNILQTKRGFTLIELLVVVAIVGVLTSITLGYLGDARKKGDDTSVKSNLNTLRAVGEIFYLDNGTSYLPSGVGISFGIAACPTYDANGTNMFSRNKNIADAVAAAVSKGIGSACYNGVDVWSVAVGLKLVPNSSWCVDSMGSAKLSLSDPISAINTGTFLCN